MKATDAARNRGKYLVRILDMPPMLSISCSAVIGLEIGEQIGFRPCYHLHLDLESCQMLDGNKLVVGS